MNTSENFPSFMPPAPATHEQLSAGLAIVGGFYQYGYTEASGKVIDEVEAVRDSMHDMQGFRGCFGLGYPFYAIDSNSTVLPVPAIMEFIEDSRQKIEDSQQAIGCNWPCVDCQRTNNLPDLKSVCGPCDKTLFKPRDLFKSLPDIDVVLVLDEATEKSETGVENRLQQLGLSQSDNDIRGSYNNTIAAVLGVDPGSEPKLPVDAHIWTMQRFLAACRTMRNNPEQGMAQIVSRSLHATWEDNRMNFWFDFMFSLTEIGDMDPELQQAVLETRKATVTALGATGILGVISRVSKRGKAIIADEQLYRLMEAKFTKWHSIEA